MRARPNGTAPHVTWFFEQFLLAEHLPGYAIHDQRLHYLFNSYYVGRRAAAAAHIAARGLITPPDL